MTETVYQEVVAGDQGDPARLALIGGWGQRTPDVTVPAALAAWQLYAGERATLALAITQEMPCVLDDGEARRAAHALGVAYVGTFGLVLAAKRCGWVTSAAAMLRTLRAVGFFIPSENVLQRELAQVGETWP